MTVTAPVQITGINASAPQALPFAPSLEVRAFVLERPEGHVLIYSNDTLGDPEGVTRWYLNHRHEAMFVSGAVTAPLFVHERERPAVEGKAHVRATFSRRHTLDDDFEVIPTPGHTPGATAYLWDSGEHRFLFTGDTIFLSHGEWVAAVLDSSDRAAYLDSLELIRELDFDVLVPWAASAGEPWYAVTSRADARRRIDAIIERVRAGADS
jgi:glyoxylase-like metal-dependent hydrolase (beta-lactamase superfamily II)